MRVLQLVKTSQGARWAVEQVRELCAAGIDVHVALPDLSGGFSSEWLGSGAQIHILDTDFPAKAPWRLPEMAREFRTLVDKVKPDLIHSHFVGTTLVMRMALGRHHPVPRIFQVPGPLHMENLPFRVWDLKSAGPQDYWIGSSRYIENLYLRFGIPHERVFRSYYGNYQAENYDSARDDLRRSFGIAPGQLVVGNISYMYPPKYYLGQFKGLKRHEELIGAFEHLGRLRKDTVGLLVGSQWGNGTGYERRLQHRAARVKTMDVILPGALPPYDAARAWPLFDLVVHAPSSENCGGVVEPLAAGVPVLAARIGGLPEVIIEGMTGVLLPNRDAQTMARTIHHALTRLDDLRTMARTGNELTRTMFDVCRTAKEVQGIYAHILQGTERPSDFDSDAYCRVLKRRQLPLKTPSDGS